MYMGTQNEKGAKSGIKGVTISLHIRGKRGSWAS